MKQPGDSRREKFNKSSDKEGGSKGPSGSSRTKYFWLMAAAGLLAYQMLWNADDPQELDYSDFLKRANAEQVDSLTITDRKIEGILKFAGEGADPAESRNFVTVMPPEENIVDRLEGKDISYKAEEPGNGPGIFYNLLFIGMPLLFLYIIYKSIKGGPGGLLDKIGESNLEKIEDVDVKFDDVAGVESAKIDLEEIIHFLNNPARFTRVGARTPRGIIMEGPPGTGKTLMAKALAGEANVPFYTISGSDFVEMFVGRGAARVRSMFETVKAEAPCILFIDEIDAIGGKRDDASVQTGNSEREQTLNAILAEMDGMNSRDNVIVVAATNRVDMLDSALMRPGRFDRKVTVGLPDVAGRRKILDVHAKKIEKRATYLRDGESVFSPDIDWDVIARATPGFSGAELENLLNEAAIFAARRDGKEIIQQDIEEARDKIIMGAESTVHISEKRKELVAWHEAAHTIVAHELREHASPIHKVTLIPRGSAAGALFHLPRENEIHSRAHLKADMAVAMAGRMGEELLYGKDSDMITAGAQSDIMQATQTAEKMVTEWGLSDKAGMRRYTPTPGRPAFSPSRTFGDAAGNEIDAEIDRILNEAVETARDILQKRKAEHKALVDALYEYETLSADEVEKVINGGEIERKPTETVPTDKPGSGSANSDNDNNAHSKKTYIPNTPRPGGNDNGKTGGPPSRRFG